MRGFNNTRLIRNGEFQNTRLIRNGEFQNTRLICNSEFNYTRLLEKIDLFHFNAFCLSSSMISKTDHSLIWTSAFAVIQIIQKNADPSRWQEWQHPAFFLV